MGLRLGKSLRACAAWRWDSNPRLASYRLFSPQKATETVTAGPFVSHGTWVSTPSPSGWARHIGGSVVWGQQLSSCYPSQQPPASVAPLGPAG